jgi:polysaccharide export outer membrane protein
MDGRISLKHIGDVKVVGMTLTQLADYLKKLYSSVYDDPIVTVNLLQSNSRRYTVMGQVNAPGIFYLDFPVTIVQAIARSGGFNEWANHDVTVIRQGSRLSGDQAGDKKSLEFDYDDFLKGKDLEKNIYLQPNDVVIVK